MEHRASKFVAIWSVVALMAFLGGVNSVRPSPPVLPGHTGSVFQTSTFKAGETSTILCRVDNFRDTYPALFWFLDGKKITKKIRFAYKGKVLQSLLSYQFQESDNGKRLDCVFKDLNGVEPDSTASIYKLKIIPNENGPTTTTTTTTTTARPSTTTEDIGMKILRSLLRRGY